MGWMVWNVPSFRKYSYKTTTYMLFASVLALLAVFSTPLRAEDQDPFQVEKGRWMSLDYYKQTLKDQPPVQVEKSEPEATQAATMPPVQPVGETKPAATASTTPMVAQPMRPIDFPIMPGMNKDHYIPVESTMKENLDDVLPPIRKSSKAAAFELPEKRWKSASEIIGQKENAGADPSDEDTKKVSVRMTYLPDARQIPAPGQETVHKQNRSAAAKTIPTPVEEPKKPEADLAACAAVDAYKKKQLEAIESDRQTLKALQSAISDLGLQKELSFMAGANSNLTTASGTTDINTSPAIEQASTPAH